MSIFYYYDIIKYSINYYYNIINIILIIVINIKMVDIIFNNIMYTIGAVFTEYSIDFEIKYAREDINNISTKIFTTGWNISRLNFGSHILNDDMLVFHEYISVLKKNLCDNRNKNIDIEIKMDEDISEIIKYIDDIRENIKIVYVFLLDNKNNLYR